MDPFHVGPGRAVRFVYLGYGPTFQAGFSSTDSFRGIQVPLYGRLGVI